MKRVLLFILALVMAFSMVACGGKNSEKGKTYEGVGDNEGQTLTITGKKVKIEMKETVDGEDAGADFKMVMTMTGTGTVVDRDGDIVEIEAKTATVSMKLTGDDADEYKDMLKEALTSSIEDEDQKEMIEDLIDGKTIKIEVGDELWESLGGIEGSTNKYELDEKEGTFEEIVDEDDE